MAPPIGLTRLALLNALYKSCEQGFIDLGYEVVVIDEGVEQEWTIRSSPRGWQACFNGRPMTNLYSEREVETFVGLRSRRRLQ